MKRWKLFENEWKRRMLVEIGEGGAGGSGAGGGTGGEGTAGGAGTGEGGTGGGENNAGGSGENAGGSNAGAGAGSGGGDSAAEVKRLTDENAKLAAYHAAVSGQVDFDDSGNLVLRGKGKPQQTEEEIEQQQAAANMAQQTASVLEQSGRNRTEAFQEFQDDVLFAENAKEAEDLIKNVRISDRTKDRWMLAYQMAAGRKIKKYEKAAEERGHKRAMEEFVKSGSAALPNAAGAGNSGGKGKDDWRSYQLTSDELSEAKKQTAHGMVKDVEEYKRILVTGR